MSREVLVNRKVIEGFFSIAEDLLLAYHLPVFTKRAKRRLILHQKFYFFDVGVFRALRPRGPLDSGEEAEGAAFETLVLQELKAINDYFNLGYQIFFWRTSHQIEVDFILYGPKGLISCEVKRTDKISKKDLQGLLAFKQDYPEAHSFLFYGGPRRQYIEGICILPITDALTHLPKILEKPATFFA
jgi:predicted AAA+ superfamily ATPase